LSNKNCYPNIFAENIVKTKKDDIALVNELPSNFSSFININESISAAPNQVIKADIEK